MSERMLKGKCPKCGEVFEFPESDKVNVVLFGNYDKYHQCIGRKKKSAKQGNIR